jgi:biotin synthase
MPAGPTTLEARLRSRPAGGDDDVSARFARVTARDGAAGASAQAATVDDALARQAEARLVAGDDLDATTLGAVLSADDRGLDAWLRLAWRLRERHFGRQVRVHVLRNAKADACPEDCAFCSQSKHFDTEIPRYPTEDVDKLVAAADAAAASGAHTYCMVTATRGPSGYDVRTIATATERIKARHPQLRVCASLGLLNEDKAAQLRAAGVDRYNHNLETSERYYGEVVSTHGWRDRVRTLEIATSAGMEACAGGILGMGETGDDRVELALSLRRLGVPSVPVNFLDPRPGTPLGHVARMSPGDALRGLVMFRLALPTADLRMAGGREVVLGAWQPLGLLAATSLFADGYLTTPGQGASRDAAMLERYGFQPVVASVADAA